MRDIQAEVTPQVAEDIEDIDAKLANDTPEDQPLYLPSDYNEGDRTVKGLTSLGALEYKMLQGAAFDSLGKLRTLVRLLSGMRTEGKKNDYGQARHTRSKTQMIDALVKFETCMGFYNKIRDALISLGLPNDDPTFRPMTEKDTHRKATTETREPGDTYKTDGLLWTGSAINADNQRLTHRPLVNTQATSAGDVVGTASSQARKRESLALWVLIMSLTIIQVRMSRGMWRSPHQTKNPELRLPPVPPLPTRSMQFLPAPRRLIQKPLLQGGCGMSSRPRKGSPTPM